MVTGTAFDSTIPEDIDLVVDHVEGKDLFLDCNRIQFTKRITEAFELFLESVDVVVHQIIAAFEFFVLTNDKRKSGNSISYIPLEPLRVVIVFFLFRNLEA